MKKTFFLLFGLAFFALKPFAQTTVTDYDGNVYNTVTIGTQVWMAENLKVTHYRNGVDIPNVTSPTQWDSLITGAYCNYNNDTSISSTYGKLYNWYTVIDNQNIAPTGWHVPSNADWSILIEFLGGDSVAGDKLKEIGTIHWQSPNAGATNETGFTALPSGARNIFGTFQSLGSGGYWWSSTALSPGNAYYQRIDYVYSDIYEMTNRAEHGFSVRCLRDSTTSINEIKNNENIQIYPNPAKTVVYLNYTETEIAKIQVYDMIGKCVIESSLTSGTNIIDVSKLSKGVYVIKIIGHNWTVQRKLTKD